MITITENENYKDYGRTLSLSNGVIEAQVTLDVGPRIIYFGFVGRQNILCDNRKKFGEMTDERFTAFYGDGKHWENLGGHRIWVTPETYPETYYPDQNSVSYTLTKSGAVFTPPAEVENGLQKSLEIRMDDDDANMQVIVNAENISKKDKEFALWSITVCTDGGTLVVPMNTDDTGYLHNRVIAVWPYTILSDDRIYFGSKYATVRQDKISPKPVKLGFDIKGERVYYLLEDTVFSKHFLTDHKNLKYPDGGCSFETYTNDFFIEVETLSDIKKVPPKKTVSHTESWSLTKKNMDIDFKNDDSIDAFLNNL